MSDKYTEVSVASGTGIGEWGHIAPKEAIEAARLHFLRERDQAVKALEDLAEGRVCVFHQYGPWAQRDRRQVWPLPAASNGANQEESYGDVIADSIDIGWPM